LGVNVTEATQTVEGDTALLPRGVRRWVLAGLCVMLAAALYLVAVRGTAILFDLGEGLRAICF
jgi:hypothetical protein